MGMQTLRVSMQPWFLRQKYTVSIHNEHKVVLRTYGTHAVRTKTKNDRHKPGTNPASTHINMGHLGCKVWQVATPLLSSKSDR